MVLSEEFKDAPSSNIPDLAGHTIDDGRLRLLNVIGRGAWGVVYRAETVSDPQMLYAVKCITRHNMNEDQRATIAQEVSLHSVCATNSPLVLQINSVIEESENGLLFIVTEFCKDGDLLEHILADDYIGKDDRIRDTFVQILDAVDSCHKRGVYHRDLKPENILCKDDCKSIVLGDFGFATTLQTTNDFRMGSEPFMSPEVRGGLHVQLRRFSSPQADIWALGVILMNLITGCLPWGKASPRDPHFIAYVLHDHDYLYHSFPISRAANEILKSIFTVDPRRRTSIADLRTRILGVKTFGPGRLPKADFSNMERYISDDIDFDTDSDTISSSSASECERGPLHIVNGVVTTESDAAVAPVTTDFVHTYRAPSERRHSSSYASSGIGPLVDDDDEIVPVSVHVAPIIEADITDEVLEYDSDLDSDSDAESEGPITPETHAVDEATTAELEDLNDLTELDLGDSSAVAEAAAAAAITVQLAPGKGKAYAPPEQTGMQGEDDDAQPPAKHMLWSTARMMALPARYRNVN